MEKLKVPELKAESKQLGLRGFSRLRRAELVDLTRNKGNILDESVPNQQERSKRSEPSLRAHREMKPSKEVKLENLRKCLG